MGFLQLALAVAVLAALQANAFLLPSPTLSRVTAKHSTVRSEASGDVLTVGDFAIPDLQDKINEAQAAMAKNYRLGQNEDISLLLKTDLSRADVYWDSTHPKIRKQRLLAHQSGDQKALQTANEDFNALMMFGLRKRFSNQLVEQEVFRAEGSQEDSAPLHPSAALKRAALRTSSQLELKKPKSEQLAEIMRKRASEKPGWFAVLPKGLHKYCDYLLSLRKQPTSGQLIRNLFVASLFSFIALINSRARMAFMYAFLGQIANMSILLTRGMPKSSVPMGMDRNQVTSWSGQSFRTAAAITFITGALVGLVSRGGLALLPELVGTTKMRIALAISVLLTGFFTSHFEVFEEKAKGGWRWKRALEGYLPEALSAQLEQHLFGKQEKNVDYYDFEYDPMVDDFPPKPKYLDEVDPDAPQGVTAVAGSNESQLDEKECAEHYARWRQVRRDSRRPPIEKANSEEAWLGGKAGLFLRSIPSWLKNSYNRHVVKSHSWRSVKKRFEKSYDEFKPIEGPVICRDRSPDWLLDQFQEGLWTEKTQASRKAARAFGTYRKTMWKIDKEVVLQPCDSSAAKKEKEE